MAGRQQHRLYILGARFCQVPEHFAFPKDAKLIIGWRLWVKSFTIQMKEAAKDSFEEKVEENGQLTCERLKVMFSE